MSIDTTEEIYNKLRKLILKAVQHNNDNNSWDMAQSFEDQRVVIEDYEAAVILDTIRPEIDKYVKAWLDAQQKGN